MDNSIYSDIIIMKRDLSKIIRAYRRLKRSKPDTWIEYSKKQKTLSLAIQCAANSVNELGKRHHHQRRLKKADLNYFGVILKANEKDIHNCTDFDSLYTLIFTLKPKGIGELTAYDTAIRIGAYMNLWPDRIYLHAGTRVGATKLVGKLSEKTITKSILPIPLKNSDLDCYELEDLLCIYKNEF